MIYLILFFICFYLLACRFPIIFCKIGMHEWDYPGGHCEDCKICDLFFGPHDPIDCDKKK
jgi:hypothetical protein